jgi:hypothetical protein
MARFLLRALTCLAPAALAVAQPAPSASPSPVQSPHGSPSQKEGWGHHAPPDDKGGGPFQRFKKRLEQMSPEERERFKENWKHWKEMGDHEREEFRQRAAREHACMEQVIDDAIAKLGLTLDSDRKEVFALRYKQERRKIEEALCQEMKAKREQQLDDMLQRLKTEFTAPKPAATAAPSPAGK